MQSRGRGIASSRSSGIGLRTTPTPPVAPSARSHVGDGRGGASGAADVGRHCHARLLSTVPPENSDGRSDVACCVPIEIPDRHWRTQRNRPGSCSPCHHVSAGHKESPVSGNPFIRCRGALRLEFTSHVSRTSTWRHAVRRHRPRESADGSPALARSNDEGQNEVAAWTPGVVAVQHGSREGCTNSILPPRSHEDGVEVVDTGRR